MQSKFIILNTIIGTRRIIPVDSIIDVREAILKDGVELAEYEKNLKVGKLTTKVSYTTEEGWAYTYVTQDIKLVYDLIRIA